MIRPDAPHRNRQRGAALLIVLLLVATLSFIALSITERTTLSAMRSINDRIRAESLWVAFGAENLALAALEQAYEATDGRMSLDDPWATQPLVAPIDEGEARLFFSDATACFNINSLAGEAGGPGLAIVSPAGTPLDEFALLVRNLGLSEFEGQALGEVIADWIDEDANRRPQGAEDGYYSTLPSPYRTANRRVAAVSEIRAMKDVTRDVYAALKPYLCAHPDERPSVINVNMLTERDAPVLAAVIETAEGRPTTVQRAVDIIAARPPGGYDEVSDFLEDAGLGPAMLAAAAGGAVALAEADGAGGGASSRFDVTSKYVRARVEIVYDTSLFEMTAEIALDDNGRGTVLSRRFGAEE